MSSSLATVLAAAEEHGRELPMAPVMYAVLALAAFAVLLLALWAFRGTAQRMSGGHAHTRASERG